MAIFLSLSNLLVIYLTLLLKLLAFLNFGILTGIIIVIIGGLILDQNFFLNFTSINVKLNQNEKKIINCSRNLCFYSIREVGLDLIDHIELKTQKKKISIVNKLLLLSNNDKILMVIPIIKVDSKSFPSMKPNNLFFISYTLLSNGVVFFKINQNSIDFPIKTKKEKIIRAKSFDDNILKKLAENLDLTAIKESKHDFKTIVNSNKYIFSMNQKNRLEYIYENKLSIFIFSLLIILDIFSIISIFLLLLRFPDFIQTNVLSEFHINALVFLIRLLSITLSFSILLFGILLLKGSYQELILSKDVLAYNRKWLIFNSKNNVNLNLVEDFGIGKTGIFKKKYFISVKFWFTEKNLFYFDNEKSATDMVNQIKYSANYLINNYS